MAPPGPMHRCDSEQHYVRTLRQLLSGTEVDKGAVQRCRCDASGRSKSRARWSMAMAKTASLKVIIRCLDFPDSVGEHLLLLGGHRK